MNMQNILKQAQKMQIEIAKAEKELKSKIYTANVNNGAVEVEVTGEYQVNKITVKEELCNTSDKEMLEDLLTIALNDALRQVSEDKEAVMNKLTGGVKVPGAF